jgi:hypothetical protein
MNGRSRMNEQELKFVAVKWIDEYGDKAPSQIRQWAKDQDLEADAPRLFEAVARVAERMISERQKKAARN